MFSENECDADDKSDAENAKNENVDVESENEYKKETNKGQRE